jgi:hypothetical protein
MDRVREHDDRRQGKSRASSVGSEFFETVYRHTKNSSTIIVLWEQSEISPTALAIKKKNTELHYK